MGQKNQDIKDQILETALEDICFLGWQWSIIENAAESAGFEKIMADAVFPEKIEDVLTHFSQWADRKMLEKLNDKDFSGVRVRDKIHEAVWVRLAILAPYKEAVRKAASKWFASIKVHKAGQSVWNTADTMWDWAGDTSEDYNFYTKRGLLVGVISTTTLRWLNDESDNHEETYAFLGRRIDNVLKVGQKAGKVLGKITPILDKFPFRHKEAK